MNKSEVAAYKFRIIMFCHKFRFKILYLLLINSDIFIEFEVGFFATYSIFPPDDGRTMLTENPKMNNSVFATSYGGLELVSCFIPMSS